MFTPEKESILVAFRDYRMVQFFQFIAWYSDTQEEYSNSIDFISNKSKEFKSQFNEIMHPDIAEHIESESGQELLEYIYQFDENLPDEIIRHIRIKSHESTLKRLKDSSFNDYMSALPEISEEEIYSALTGGYILNCHDTNGGYLPIRSDENYSGAFLEEPIATAKVDAKVLSSAISKASSGSADLVVNPKGLRLYQVMVVEELDLNWVDCPFPIGFEGCSFTKWLSLDYMKAPWLSFEFCDFKCRGGFQDGKPGAINGSGMKIETDLRLLDNQNLGQLFLLGSVIGTFSPRNQEEDFTPSDSGSVELPAESDEDSSNDIRVVLNEVTIKNLYISLERKNYFKLGNDAGHFKIESIILGEDDASNPKMFAERLVDWLFKRDNTKNDENNIYNIDSSTAQEFENALSRSGFQEVSKEFGILVAELSSKTEGAKGLLKRVFLGKTVRYFYENTRALWFILGLWCIAWALMLTIALAAPDTLTASPLANEYAYQEQWVKSFLNAAGWSLLYSLDLVFSPLSLGQTESFWSSIPFINIIFALIKGLSLMFMGLFLTGVTHITDRNSK